MTPQGRIWGCIGRRVQVARDAIGMSQEDLAARVGYTRASIANLEAGRQGAVDAVRMALIAKALGTTSDDLVRLDDLNGGD